jgi:TnpA family transposase
VPVSFLTPAQRSDYGRYDGNPSKEDLAQYFHLDDHDHALILRRRGKFNRLGFALQLTTVRYLGKFLENPSHVPDIVIWTLAHQLGYDSIDGLEKYQQNRQRLEHVAEIQLYFGYRTITEFPVGFRLCRWLYVLCWTGTDRPGVLFDRATAWLLTHKILLPGITVLERVIARLRQRVEKRLWTLLTKNLNFIQRDNLDQLLTISGGGRRSVLDKLRSGPTIISAPALVKAIKRLEDIRALDITIPVAAKVPPSRLAALARFANTSKVSAIARLPKARRLATLVAFVYTLEASAMDDVLQVLEILLRDLFNRASRADQKARLRSLKDLDAAAMVLVRACSFLLDSTLESGKVRIKIFETIQKEQLAEAIQEVSTLVRPPQDVFYGALHDQHRHVRWFLPTVLKYIQFNYAPAGKKVVDALTYLQAVEKNPKQNMEPPMEIVTKACQPYVVPEKDQFNRRAYMFCTLDYLKTAISRRDVYVNTSWRYADPRAGMLTPTEWESARPLICRTLGLSTNTTTILDGLTEELDQTYRRVVARLPDNQAVRIESTGQKHDLILSPLDKVEDTPSLKELRKIIESRMPRVDLPEIVLEIANRTNFHHAFTHISERDSRAEDLATSICAVLIAEACNIGFRPLVRDDIPALRRDRLSWVNQNYVRHETITRANACLVSAQSKIPLAKSWGGGEVASADGMRFIVPVKTIHAGSNPKYFAIGRGITWYNLISDQFTGLHGIPVPGTLKDSLVLLAVLLEQSTELQPTQIMTDTGAYTDIIFALFRLLGFRFCPHIADIGGTRFWRIDGDADYGDLNKIAKHTINMDLAAEQLDDCLRLVGSLKIGHIPATGIMRTLQVGDKLTRLAKGLAEISRIEKTIHNLNYIDDENKRRATRIQLNRGEARHALARAVFHGKRGELRQRYREGQEDQLGALGLVVNIIVLWNTIYIDAIINELRREGYPVNEDDAAHLSPLGHGHLNMLGRYSFVVPDSVERGELRPLRDPREDDDLE